MKLIVGLGNIGSEYDRTRHNLGFQVIDFLANNLNIELSEKNFKGLYTISEYSGQKVILLKPLTYMNNSGECIQSFIKYFKIPLKNILVIYDDLSLPLSSFRYRQKGSSGGHNGIKSIIECLNSQEFPRLKVGIGSNQQILWKDWVLQKFRIEEKRKIDELLPILEEKLLQWIKRIIL